MNVEVPFKDFSGTIQLFVPPLQLHEQQLAVVSLLNLQTHTLLSLVTPVPAETSQDRP